MIDTLAVEFMVIKLSVLPDFMSDSSQPTSTSFTCRHCHEDIYIPPGLPPTVAPCPHCGKEVTSPDFEQADALSSEVPADEQTDEQVVRLQVKDQDADPDVDQQRGTQDIEFAPESTAQNKRFGQGAKMILAGAVLLLLGIGGMAFWLTKQSNSPSSPSGVSGNAKTMTAEQLEQEWITTGWKAEASEVLAAFMKAKSPTERMKYVIPNEGVLKELEMFYPEGCDDSNTPMELFAHRMGSEADHKRGIFFMQYRQPSQADIRDHFEPIGSLDKVLGVKSATLIDMAYQINEDNLSQPIGVNAFFKKTDDGLKLDSSVFIQSKFRTFRAFVDYPRPGKKRLFRVVIGETVDHDLRDDKRYRTYRLDDFAYPQDHVNVSVLVDSEVGKILSVINWRGMNREMVQRTATIVLGWSKQTPPALQIERVICWQFLGVGGEIGNTKPVQETSSMPVSPAPGVLQNEGGE